MDDRDAVLWALVGVLLIGALTLIWNGALAGPRPVLAQVADEETPAADAPALEMGVASLLVVKGRGLSYLTTGRARLLAAGTGKGLRVYEIRGYSGQFQVRDVTAAADETGAAPMR